jgi:phosphatidylinositol alpha-mannosyltransferase
MRTVGAPLRIAMISYYMPSGSKIGVGYQVHAIANMLVARADRRRARVTRQKR